MLYTQLEVRVSDKPKSVLDVIAWCQSLEDRLAKVEKNGFQIIDIGSFEKKQQSKIMDGSGDRSIIEHIEFKETLETVPQVFTSISGLDTDSKFNPRISVNAENITPEGCDIVMKTWGPSNVAYVKVSWIVLISL